MGCILLELQVPPLLTKARAQEYFSRAKHSSGAHPRTLGHRVPAGTPSALGAASFREVVSFPPKSSLGASSEPPARQSALEPQSIRPEHLVLLVNLHLIVFLAHKGGSDEKPFAAGPH